MLTMSNAPLLYTLAMLRFPKVINIERFVGDFQDRIRSDYPLYSTHQAQSLQLVLGEHGPGMKSASEKLWQFSNTERDHALILSAEFLVLHAGRKYGGHHDFIARFVKAFESLCQVENIVTVMTSLGYRYIDLVVPKVGGNDSLVDYLQPWVMQSSEQLKLADGVTLQDSAYIAGFKTPQGVLRFQVLRQPPTTLPPELDSPFVRENGWVEPLPDGEFALLDLDHASVFSTAVIADPGRVADELAALRRPLVDLFSKAITTHALREWNGKP